MVAARQRILRVPRLAIENVRQGYLARRLLPAGVVHHGVLREDGRRMWSAMSLPDRDRPIHVSFHTPLFYPSPLPQKVFCTEKLQRHFRTLLSDTWIGRPRAPASSYIIISFEGCVVPPSSGQLQDHGRVPPVRRYSYEDHFPVHDAETKATMTNLSSYRLAACYVRRRIHV